MNIDNSDKEPMKNRTFRVSDILWNAGIKKARPIGLSDVLRVLLKAYVDGELDIIIEDNKYRLKK